MILSMYMKVFFFFKAFTHFSTQIMEVMGKSRRFMTKHHASVCSKDASRDRKRGSWSSRCSQGQSTSSHVLCFLVSAQWLACMDVSLFSAIWTINLLICVSINEGIFILRAIRIESVKRVNLSLSGQHWLHATKL